MPQTACKNAFGHGSSAELAASPPCPYDLRSSALICGEMVVSSLASVASPPQGARRLAGVFTNDA